MPTFEILMEAQHVFGGRFPDIATPDDLKSLPAELGDTDPVFVTLPIGRADAESRNGRKYPRAAVQAMVDAINKNKPDGAKGHLKESDRPYVWVEPPLMWMAATMESDGTAWAKAYVMPEAKGVRDYIKARKKTRTAVGTSLYGMGEMDDEGTVTKLEIESIDLVHPQRVGVPMAAAIPIVTAETFDPTRAADGPNPTLETSQPKDTPMDTTLPTTTPVAAPVPAVPAAPVSETEQQRKHTEEKRVLQETITKQNHDLKDFQQIVSELGNPDDAVSAVRALKEKLRQNEAENMALLEETMKSKVNELVKLPTVQPIVLTMLKNKKPTTRAAVEQHVKEIVDTPMIADLLKEQVVVESGPAHVRPATDPAKKTDAPADGFFIPGY